MGKQNEHESKEKAQVTEPVLWVKDYFYTVLEGGGGAGRGHQYGSSSRLKND